MAEREANMFNIRERAIKKIADTFLLFDVAVVKSYRQIEEDIFKTAKDENEYFKLLARLLLDIQSLGPKRKEEVPKTACPDKATQVTTCLPVAFAVPRPKTTQAKVNEKKQKVIMQHMVRLLCASTCLTKKMQPGLNPNRKCSFPNCELYQEKVQHMMACEQITKCPVRHCSASRRLLSHWLQCKKMMCLICNPICRLLLIWRAHYDNVFNEGEEDCPDITTITHGVGGISLNIINQPKFNTVLRLMHGISIQENEDLDDVIGVINRMNIRDSMNGSRTSTGGPAVDDFGMGSMLRMLEQISVEEGEFNSMLKLMQTTSLSDAQISSKDDVTANPEEVVDALNKQHDHNADSSCPVPLCNKFRKLCMQRRKTKSFICARQQGSSQSQMSVALSCRPIRRINHHRHVPYVILRDTSQHYPQLGVRHQGPNSYADRLLCPLKPSPIGISSNYLNIYIGTEVDELINLIKTPEQAIRAFHALKNIGKPNISFLQHLQQILKKSLLRETKHSAEEGIFQIKFMYEQVVYSRISQQLHTSFTSMSIKPTPPS